MRIIFLCSGSGGTMKFIHHIQQKTSNLESIKIIAVIADRKCGAINYAKENSIDNHLHNFKRTITDNKYLIQILNNYSADVIITNVHKIISKTVLEKVNSIFINNHYSILPAFKGHIGMKSLQEALKINCKFLGASSHFVSEELDGGEIISQAIFPKDESENLEEQVFISGCLTLLSALLYVSGFSIKSTFYKNIQINPGINIPYSKLKSIFKETLV